MCTYGFYKLIFLMIYMWLCCTCTFQNKVLVSYTREDRFCYSQTSASGFKDYVRWSVSCNVLSLPFFGRWEPIMGTVRSYLSWNGCAELLPAKTTFFRHCTTQPVPLLTNISSVVPGSNELHHIILLISLPGLALPSLLFLFVALYYW